MSKPFDFLDTRPIVIALAGSDGAGKSTFYKSHFADSGLRFINADELSASLDLSAYDASALAVSIRRALVAQRESFIFETVLSDPVGEKVEQLAAYVELGYTVVLIFIHLDSANESSKRVSIRTAQGGHDVPEEKLQARFDRTQANLLRAIRRLPHVIVYSNQDLSDPFRFVARYEHGRKRTQKTDE